MRSRLALVPLLVALFACSDRTISTEPRLVIADAARDYKRGFYWLPPMVKQPTVTGAFDATLSPTVQICELVQDRLDRLGSLNDRHAAVVFILRH